MSPRGTAAAARALHARCWTAASSHDLDTLLLLARDTALTADMVSTIAPSARERDADVRLLVALHPLVTDPALDILCVDSHQDVRDAALERRTGRP